MVVIMARIVSSNASASSLAARASVASAGIAARSSAESGSAAAKLSSPVGRPFRPSSVRLTKPVLSKPVTEANERLLEHYRRVAFALENFGTYASPWDDRGNAYIRYGDPDHVSRSNDLRLERDARVLAVKEALISQAAEADVGRAKAVLAEVNGL